MGRPGGSVLDYFTSGRLRCVRDGGYRRAGETLDEEMLDGFVGCVGMRNRFY